MRKDKKVIKIGTRGSKLALAQTNMVIDALTKANTDIECEIVVIHTTGDKILDKPLLEFGGKGVFVLEFEEALLKKDIDFAVHSAKDMPMELTEGLEIAGVLKREDPRDVLITKKSKIIDKEDTAIIGTSSLRRQLQIQKLYPNILCNALRGNVNTRLQKLTDGLYDGIILAAAGIKRLKLDKELNYNFNYLSFEEMVPAGGQGIIAIEGRKDCEIGRLIKDISDSESMIRLETERRVLELFEAGCHEPIGVISQITKDEIPLKLSKK
jgi:hydroxymethylbilane synthase